LTGSSGNNTITGSSGNDAINGGGGQDHLFGGSGDDIFIIDGSSLALGATINGGAGTNSVSLSANSGSITDSELSTSLMNVQFIDFTASNVNAALNLSGSQVSLISGGVNNTLAMQTNGGDTVNITDPFDSVVNGTTTSYTIYDVTHTTITAHLDVTLVA
jgi:hypothetical protein